jgi:DNA-binding NtrC family response regulator
MNKSGFLDVLVVDDELLIRWSLTETLANAGHTVSEAADRASALKALRESPRPPDVVLLDYRLPDSNDLGLLTAIRQIAPKAQVIMMTAFGTPEMTKGALDLGAYRVVNKPFEVDDVAALVLQAHAASH